MKEPSVHDVTNAPDPSSSPHIVRDEGWTDAGEGALIDGCGAPRSARESAFERRLLEYERRLEALDSRGRHKGLAERMRGSWAWRWGIGVALVTTPVVVLAIPSMPTHVFTAGTPIVAAEVNENFAELYEALAAAEAEIAGLKSTAAGAACPGGYTQDVARTDIVLCKKGADEMVKVGDFWVDRFEASVWSNGGCTGTQYGAGITDDYPSSFPDTGQWSTRLYACSKIGVMPSANLTWFQAQQACLQSGKHLATDAEWQAAAAGTFDPGANDGLANQNCNTFSAGPRNTGLAGPSPAVTCVSRYGAEDMVGNLWEWTADWRQAGQTWQSADGQSQCASGCAGADGWPGGYNGDATWNVNGRTSDGTRWWSGVPAGSLRGGDWGLGAQAGVFTLNLYDGPSNQGPGIGFRCARRG